MRAARGSIRRAAVGGCGVGLCLLLLATGCVSPAYRQVSLSPTAFASPTALPTAGMPPLRMAVAAILSPQTTTHDYGRLVAYLEHRLDRPVELIQRGTYAETNELIRTRQVDLAFVCTGAYVQGERDFGLEVLVVPQVAGETSYRSYLIVPADSSAQRLEDLRGGVFAFTDPFSLSGYLVSLYALQLIGETPDTFFGRTLFTYSHDNSIRAVMEGWVDGAAVDSLVYDALTTQDPAYRERTRVIWRSETFGAPPVVVHPGLHPEVKEQWRRLFLEMDQDVEGRYALLPLGVERFVAADSRLYDSARAVLAAVGAPQ